MRPRLLTHCLLLALCASAIPVRAQPPFLSETVWTELREAASGAAAYENLRVLSGLHRVPGTAPFDQAADFMLLRAQEYGLHDAHLERFPIDGTRRYGLMRSYLSWRVDHARLWQVSPQATLLGDWATDPIRLADYSHSAALTAPLIDVGAGTREADYAGKDVRGKIVLADGVLSDVQALAVAIHGAAGILSDMPNQTTAWSGQDRTLVRWGHLDARQSSSFAFMIAPATADALRVDLRLGHPVTLRADVKAEVGPGHWTVVTATIPGTHPEQGEVVYSCHLDHQRPGANDNGSGCVTILEVARLLQHLIQSGALPPPQRTLRFLWGPEVEGTMAYLSEHPDIRRSLRANVHMDMVGGDPFKDKAILHVTETPWSLPSFVTDVGAAFAERIRDAATAYAEDGSHAAEAVLEDRNGGTGTRNTFLVDQTPYAEGSDHDDYDAATIAVPSLYLRDWPDIYIHTDHDTLDRIDATKLRRVALLGAASGYTYATASAVDAPEWLPFFAARAGQRLAKAFERADQLQRDGLDAPPAAQTDAVFEARNLLDQVLRRETTVLQGFLAFTGAAPGAADEALDALRLQTSTFHRWLRRTAQAHGRPAAEALPAWTSRPLAAKVPQRIGPFGPLSYQNDDVLLARLGPERVSRIQLLAGDTSRLLSAQDRGALYGYEIVNFVDGRRTIGDIRNAVSAEFGPVPLEAVADYLQACEDAGVIRFDTP